MTITKTKVILKDLLANSRESYTNFKRAEWVLEWPGQVSPLKFSFQHLIFRAFNCILRSPSPSASWCGLQRSKRQSRVASRSQYHSPPPHHHLFVATQALVEQCNRQAGNIHELSTLLHEEKSHLARAAIR